MQNEITTRINSVTLKNNECSHEGFIQMFARMKNEITTRINNVTLKNIECSHQGFVQISCS